MARCDVSLSLCSLVRSTLNNSRQNEQVIAQRKSVSVDSILVIAPSLSPYSTVKRIIGTGCNPAIAACCCMATPSACNWVFSACRAVCISWFRLCLRGKASIQASVMRFRRNCSLPMHIWRYCEPPLPLQLVKPEDEHGFNSVHEVRPQLTF